MNWIRGNSSSSAENGLHLRRSKRHRVPYRGVVIWVAGLVVCTSAALQGCADVIAKHPPRPEFETAVDVLRTIEIGTPLSAVTQSYPELRIGKPPLPQITQGQAWIWAGAERTRGTSDFVDYPPDVREVVYARVQSNISTYYAPVNTREHWSYMAVIDTFWDEDLLFLGFHAAATFPRKQRE